jgi:hypothetical protein
LDESWRAIGEINIKNCKAYGFAKQVNVPITDERADALIAGHDEFALKALQSDPGALAAILSQGLPPQLQ